ncbi:MAG: SPOR domain-containing protein [Ramlibacter sp.]
MKQQRGGLILGLIIGVVIGLAAALAVAVYVTKVPVPFMNKGQNRTADQDAAEARKNKDWDPNAPLYGKNPARPAAAASAASPAAAASAPRPAASAPAARAEVKPAVSGDPLGDLARAKAGIGADPFLYFIQAGAYRTAEDAEAQRAKLSLIGLEAKVTEREQSGRTVYRVRVGPFEKKDEADRQKERLEAGGVETALVRVQR